MAVSHGEEPPAYSSVPEPDFSFAVNTAHHGQPASTLNRRIHAITTRVGRPLNRAANVVGAEGCWPTSIKSECTKVARILQSFTGLDYAAPSRDDSSMRPSGASKKSMIKIPDAALRNCAGLAVFNVFRAGIIHGSLAGGSGLVVARRLDGSWSPPSSFVVSTVGAGVMVGLDMYDCVCVLNTAAQVDAFTNPRLSLGGEASVALGPVGAGRALDSALCRTARPVWTYVKSRGLWAGVQVEGTIIISRADANSVFYNERGISAKKILRGQVAWPVQAKPLLEMLHAMDGCAGYDYHAVQEADPVSTSSVDVSHELPAMAELEQPQDRVLDEKERLTRVGY
ncbi:hypothetical protein CDD81_6201 [Ophiocordyceps australis]|uniref:Ysc84 actin-binding domain-containing protein n=1 Tax=Ophiocordyceps australis TaxID=1399860 RepID=A0A2C5Y6U0_9HYPO|nr:hypothetical protein CDD81_6201 [Ophiocordyceps australis]